jgi:hypothetical protein
LIVRRFGLGLWTYPLRIDTSAQGLQIFYPTKWKPDGADLMTDMPILIGGRDFAAADSRAKDWSDWMATFRMAQSPDKYMDVTLGQGMPYVWTEFHGVQPTIAFGGNGKQPAAGGSAKFFGLGGKPVTLLPLAGDALGIEYGGRNYAVFAPAGSKFEGNDKGLTVTFSGPKQFLVTCPLPAAKDIDSFHRYAFAIPRDTRMSWKYSPDQGTISTTWKITTEALQGDEKQIIQGWLPHQYRTNLSKIAYDGPTYLTGRGTMRCTVGNEFTFVYPFTGIVPNLPAPKPGTPGYDPAKLTALINQFTAKPGFGGDTYGGGKDLVRFAQYAFIAQQLKDPSYPKIVEAVRAALVNWLTYTPGEKDHFFAYYPHNKGLIGFNTSYGSENFTDNHFHYGYFTFAAGMLSANDPSFATDYGPMAKLVAKQYANWDRDDKRFPFMRTFDIWAGHSWASGSGSDNGTHNQESSSEAMQSWEGLIVLGQALGDADMVATGVMGYNYESQSTLEYWFNAHGDVFPPEWKHPMAAMIWSSSKVWGTWFTGDPAWYYGIQWIPTSPAASFFVHDPAWARKNFETMIKEIDAKEAQTAAKKPGYKPKPATIKASGGELGSYHLGYALMYDPKWVLQQFDALWNEPGDKVAHNTWMANIYYEASSMLSLGHVDWTSHLGSATSMVYVNDATKTRTWLVWNPLPKPQVVKAYTGGKLTGQMVAAPGGLTSATSLQPAK